MALTVDIAVFAHDEGAGIAAMVAGLAAQDILHGPDFAARVLVLANGCRDDTAARARAVAVAGIEVVELATGGKARTWNRFVHDLSRPGADILILADADISLEAPDALSRLARGLADRPGLWVLNSQPVKDIVARPGRRSLTDRLIAAAGGGLDDWKTAICGQLYAMPAARARRFHLPVGLPVEDGFLRALVLTDAFTAAEDFTRIDGLAGLRHIYASERHIGGLIRHQTRIVIGGAINSICFDWLTGQPAPGRHEALARVAADPGWLGAEIARRLPRWPHGFVPGHFLVKRLTRLGRGDLMRPRRLLLAFLGFGFDLIVYLRAQIAMARGAGSGFW